MNDEVQPVQSTMTPEPPKAFDTSSAQGQDLLSHTTGTADDSIEAKLIAFDARLLALETEFKASVESRVSKLESFMQTLVHPSKWFGA